MPEPVLVVEDDPDVREVMMAIVESEGHRAVAAENGDEALQLLRAGLHPCLILLDLMMPVKDGWEFRAEQRTDPALASIPTIIVSAVGRQSIDALQPTAALEKPIDYDQLTRLLKRHCITNHLFP